jgi:hypothetical protein
MRLSHVAVLAALAFTPAAAHAQLPAGPVTAKNVEFVANFAEITDSAGARLHDGFFYVTTERSLTIYDVSKPEAPKKVGSLSFPPASLSNYYVPEEDPDTNGKILLTSEEGAVEVIDVRDKTAPKFLAKLPESSGFTAQHTISCVLDCSYAYGSGGTIIDLRDPANPKPAGNWATGRALGSTHDVTEVSPGMVLTSSTPMYLLDARTDPAHPTTMAVVGDEDSPFNHANLWPNGMQDDIALVGGESIGPQCADAAAASFRTYDTTDWANTGTFTPLSEFRLDTGLLVDGRMADSTWCVHWFTTHPTYRNGGLVAIAWYEHGTRFLRVGRDGSVSEVGWFLPLGTSASAAYWITDRIVYVSDYNRGLDVLKYTGDFTPGEPAP